MVKGGLNVQHSSVTNLTTWFSCTSNICMQLLNLSIIIFIDFWSHCESAVFGPTERTTAQYLHNDSAHFNQEGNRQYYNRVRGAVIAAANKLK